ncbi:uncharacterized protein LOC127583413 [Pristis pectinata]|uniref:uncharacterized protein LOC127583413 n=1 Tax=Pristis pectinata TaxID=685728 RepID=UPI00223E60FE|nr:uncharacterized protein LOC127583413 [Pristis pectinata]
MVKVFLVFITITILCPNNYVAGLHISTCKTEWFDRDNPSGQGDYEDLNNLRNEFPNHICTHPVACEVETTSGVPASQTGENIRRCNVSTGFICVNNEQSDGRCEDYRIRFTCPQSFCAVTTPPVSTCKTEWFDRDNPSGQGDYEDLNNLRNEFPNRICTHPVACEVETTSGVPTSQTGENIRRCNVSDGFFCVNNEQSDGRCEDYRIRFTCPQSFCAVTTPPGAVTIPPGAVTAPPVSTCKTRWFNHDNPSGQGDYEDLTNLRNQFPDHICTHPIACEVETTSGVPASQTGENIRRCTVSTGFFCVNNEQSDGRCEDYRIRFTCPQSFCNCKTQWFDRDDPTGIGDYETLMNLRNENPGLICSNPVHCEVETLSGIPASSTGDIVSNCSVISGFVCVNAEQTDGSCEDYRIQFMCPESFCSCKTQWFDYDDPSGFGDFEDLANLRRHYPDKICRYPTACEVETVSGIPASLSGDNILKCNISTGFICVNSDQKDGSCEDYGIRFTCPESFCDCKTQWFDRDDTSGKGDFETLANLQNEYPGHICRNPTACEVETISGIPASETGENIAPCSTTFGFTCLNENQNDGLCEDYRIRFSCPKSFCNCVTQWFDRDDPSGKGDFENLDNLRKGISRSDLL